MGERLTGRGTAWMRVVVIVPLLVAGVVLGAPAPMAAAEICNTGEVASVGRTFESAIVVEADTWCVLHTATIRGGVTVEPGGILLVYNSEIRGSVSGTAVNTVDIEYSVVRGGVTVNGAERDMQIVESEVRGNVTFTGATNAALLIFATVRGSATLDDNTEAYAVGNTIRGDLSCSGNGFATNVAYWTNQAYPNTVAGARLGQCANL